MLHGEAFGLLLGAVALGAVHGVEPGHGWPVAASYALDQSNKWLYGFAASLIIGVGHLVSSIAMVAVFFYAKSYFSLTQVNEPILLAEDVRIGVGSVTLFEGVVTIGGPVSLVAGVLLILLGLREYYGGHSHDHVGHDDGGDGNDDGHHHSHGHDDHSHGHDDHSHGNDHGHGDDGHSQKHDHSHQHHEHGQDHDHSHESDEHGHHDRDRSNDSGWWDRIRTALPFVGGHSHDHDAEEAAERGLFGIAWFAFLLGFAHEEEFEIIALCAGSTHCLELMGAYALTVIVGIVGLTLLLVAGYHRYEERVERYTPYLPVFSAVVLIVMGIGFVLGLF